MEEGSYGRNLLPISTPIHSLLAVALGGVALRHLQVSEWKVRSVGCVCLCYGTYAPINIRPHYPPYGTQVGIGGDLHVNFDPRGGAFDLSPHNLCHEAVKKYWSLGSLWENQKEAEWLPSLEEGKN